MDLVVRRPRHGDGASMEALYRAAFGSRFGGVRLRRVTFQADECLVAALDGRIVGVGCHERARADLDPHLACLQPEARRFVEPLGDLADAAIRIEAPPGVAPIRGPDDRVFTALAVDPRVRRHGIGRALALHRLELAVEDQVDQVFVHCIDGSGSRELYLDLGFVPLVRVARHYRDGTGMSLLYRPL